MLDENLIVEDLEPRIWTHLQEVLDVLLPPAQILHILYKEDSVRGVTENGKPLEVTSEDVTNIERLWQRYPRIDEIRIYRDESLDIYDRILQEDKVYGMDIDEYLEFQYEKLKEIEGIQIYERPPRKKHIFSLLKEWIDGDGCYLLWVSREGILFFNCILLVEEGRIVRLTTSGRYPEMMNDLERVRKCAEKEFCMPVYCATMEYKL